jgi:hypothetical protein
MADSPAPDPVAAYLAGARARFSNTNYAITTESPRMLSVAVASTSDVPPLLAAVEAVLKRHAPTGAFPPGSDVCTECGIERDVPWSWPCPTIEAISAALLGREDDDE